jgi:hypothetical protein
MGQRPEQRFVQQSVALARRTRRLIDDVVADERLSDIGWTLRPLVASDPRLGRAREDHHCDGL